MLRLACYNLALNTHKLQVQFRHFGICAQVCRRGKDILPVQHLEQIRLKQLITNICTRVYKITDDRTCKAVLGNVSRLTNTS